MPSTTNFGWTTPADTDYVKDGALAIRTLGNGIDTSLVDLKGGTTGQILSKASNTDLDYTWINNDQGDITGVTASSPLTGGGTSGAVTVGIQDGTTAQKGAVQLEDSTSSTSTTTAATPNSVKSAYDLANGAIAKSLVDAKGDLIVGTADNTVARLAVGGTNGHILTVDSSTASGMKWAAAAGGGKILQVVQTSYGTSATSTSTSWADTGLSASITPATTGSRILIFITQFYELFRNTADCGGGIALLRGSTFIFGDEAASAPISLYMSPTGSTSNYFQNCFTLAYVDSPSTTSSTTYKTQFAVTSAANSGRMKVQLNDNNSSMILMEIGA